MSFPFSLPFTQTVDLSALQNKFIDAPFALDLKTYFDYAPDPIPLLRLPTMPPSQLKEDLFKSSEQTLTSSLESRVSSQSNTDDSNSERKSKAAEKKPAVLKLASPPNQPIHPLFEAYKLSTLLNPSKEAEDLLMTLSVEQLRYMEGVLSRIKKRKNYHMKKGNPYGAVIPFTPLNPVTEPEIPIDLTLPRVNMRESFSIESKFASREAPTPSLSSSGTSPSSFQAITSGVIENSTENILIKDNNQIWMSFKSNDSGVIYEVHAEIDITKPEPTDLTPEFKAVNSIYPHASTEAEKQKNVLGWWLSYLNPQLLTNNVPLLRQAADTFLVTFPGMFAATNCETLSSQSLPPVDTSDISASILVVVHSGRNSRSMFLRSDIEKVDLNLVDEEFKEANCVFPRAYERIKRSRENELTTEVKRGRHEVETVCNEWAWKLAYLNPVELAGNLPQLQSALDTYRNTFSSVTTRPHRSLSSVSSDFRLDFDGLALNSDYSHLLPQ